MTRKEQFIAFVLAGSTARDAHAETRDSILIVQMASRIPGEAIPVNVMNAAKVYLAFCCYEGKRPFRWMTRAPSVPPGLPE